MSRERDRERRDYEADVQCAVWRSGGNPDRVDPERVEDAWYDGRSSDAAARAELQRQRPARDESEMRDEGGEG